MDICHNAIRQNISKKANPTQTDINVAIYEMEKNITVILHNSVPLKDPKKQH